MGLEIPRLYTERTLMRGCDDGDLDAVAAYMADPEVMRFVGGTRDRAEAWRGIAVWAGHWALRGYGLWGVERAADGVLIGRVGLWYPEGWPGLEVGWTLCRAAWGQGYATECAAAATAWAWANLPDLPRLVSVIDPDNTGSRRVAERLGMAVVGRASLGGVENLLYGIDRPAGA